MELCMSHYSYKCIPDAKFEADSSSSLGDMTSQNFPRKKGTNHQIRLFTPRNELNIKKISYISRIVLLEPNPSPMSISGTFFIFKIYGTPRLEKSSSNPLD